MANNAELFKKIKQRKEASQIDLFEEPAYSDGELSLEKDAYFDFFKKSKMKVHAPTLPDRHLFLSAMDFVNTMQYEIEINVKEKEK